MKYFDTNYKVIRRPVCLETLELTAGYVSVILNTERYQGAVGVVSVEFPSDPGSYRPSSLSVVSFLSDFGGSFRPAVFDIVFW